MGPLVFPRGNPPGVRMHGPLFFILDAHYTQAASKQKGPNHRNRTLEHFVFAKDQRERGGLKMENEVWGVVVLEAHSKVCPGRAGRVLENTENTEKGGGPPRAVPVS